MLLDGDQVRHGLNGDLGLSPRLAKKTSGAWARRRIFSSVRARSSCVRSFNRTDRIVTECGGGAVDGVLGGVGVVLYDEACRERFEDIERRQPDIGRIRGCSARSLSRRVGPGGGASLGAHGKYPGGSRFESIT